MSNSELSEIEKLRAFLESKNIRYISRIQSNKSTPFDFSIYISEDTLGEHGGRSKGSRRQLDQLSKEIQKSLKISIEWIITTGQKRETIEAGLKALVDGQTALKAKAIYLSPTDINPVSVFVDFDGTEPPANIQSIKELITRFLLNLGFSTPSIVISNELTLPTTPAIIRKLKAIAPATIDTLSTQLQSSNFTLPTPRWLQSRLDTLRKQKMVIRFKDGLYALTEHGLRQIPQSRKRSSSDIERALALGKRQW